MRECSSQFSSNLKKAEERSLGNPPALDYPNTFESLIYFSLVPKIVLCLGFSIFSRRKCREPLAVGFPLSHALKAKLGKGLLEVWLHLILLSEYISIKPVNLRHVYARLSWFNGALHDDSLFDIYHYCVLWPWKNIPAGRKPFTKEPVCKEMCIAEWIKLSSNWHPPKSSTCNAQLQG